MKRKHAELIHAWAEGAKIQYFDISRNEWLDTMYNNPSWFDDTEYRLKPKTTIVRFRNYVHEGSVKVHSPGTAIPPPGEMKWIGDWQTVEVEIVGEV